MNFKKFCELTRVTLDFLWKYAMIVIVKDKDRQPTKAELVKENLESLKNQLCQLTTKAALLVLIQKYRRSSQTIFVGGTGVTVGKLRQDLTEEEGNRPCVAYDIRFYGGPPAAGQWFNGSVLTLLCDAILFEEHNNAPFELAIAL